MESSWLQRGLFHFSLFLERGTIQPTNAPDIGKAETGAGKCRTY